MSVPERWQELIELVLAPVAWIPRMQEVLLGFFLTPGSPWASAAKYVFLLFPALLGVAAVWITLLSLYTLPFRRYRLRFVSMLLLAWWDAARAVTLYWAGILRVAAVAVGWGLSLVALVVRLLVEALQRLATTPVVLAGRGSQGPWVAFGLLLVWSALEAAVLTYATIPAVSRALTGVSGGAEESRFTAGALYAFLLLLVMGSFACLQTLTEALRSRDWQSVVRMGVVQLLVMVFEVLFLYRPLVAALTPAAADAAARPSFWSALALATLGWLATRAATWFLFARYGTAPMLAFIARGQDAEAPAARVWTPPAAWWRPGARELEREVEWLHAKGDQLAEYLALPVLQLVAAALNFGLLLVASRPAFPLPFKTLRDVTETRELLATLQLMPRKQPLG
ncbi:MAG TPA: hypothetical protein VFV05_26525 [Methylomirabilota bacterium]|nr:hypothetical protein [Methylomirabilota bacterium]